MSKKFAKNFVDNVEKQLYLSIQEKTESITFKLEKVLKGFNYQKKNLAQFMKMLQKRNCYHLKEK